MTTQEGVDGKVHEPSKPMNGKTSIGIKPDNHINKPVVGSNSPQNLANSILPTHLRKSPNGLDKVAKISNGSKGSAQNDEAFRPIAIADVSLGVAPTTPPTKSKISSNGLANAAKISNGAKNPSPSDDGSKHVPHYLRPSTGSCHHYCKYGVKPEKPHPERNDSYKHHHNHATSANKTPSGAPKSTAAKTPKSHKSISDTPSPVKLATPVKSPSSATGTSSAPVGHSSKVSPKEKTAVSKSEYQPKVIRSTALKSKTSPSLPSKSSSEKKTKASFSPKPVISGIGKANLFSPPPSQALNDNESTKKVIQSQNHALNIHGSAKKATPLTKYALDGHSNAKSKVPVLIEKSVKRREKNGVVNSESASSPSQNSSSDPQHERPDRDGTAEVCSYKEELPANDQICASDAEDAHQTVEVCSDKEELPTNDQICLGDAEDSHQFDEHSHSAGETSEEHPDGVMEHIDTEGDEQSVEEYCHDCSHRNDVTISAPCEIIDGDKFADEKNDDSEPHGERIDEYRPYGESLTEDYIDEDFDSEYSEEDSEYDDSYGNESNDEHEELGKVRKQHHTTVPQEGSQSLEKGRFRRGQIVAGSEEDNRRLEKRRFRRGRIIDSSNPRSKPENVNLRHQEFQARKASEEWMLNHVIEKEVNKLAPVRKSKVKTLVGAFETVILLKESEIGEPKHAGIRDVSLVSPPNEHN